MGLPYSKQIHSAFDQSQIMMRRLQTEVTPLVAAGYPLITRGLSLLKTTKNIAILLAFVQVYTALMLTVHLFVLGMLLVTTNPDLEEERMRVVTPVVRAGVEWVERWEGWIFWGMKAMIVVGVAGLGVSIWMEQKVGEEEKGIQKIVEEEIEGEGEGEEENDDCDTDEMAKVGK